MSVREEAAYPLLRQHDVDYVLVIFGGLIGFSGDDINKFLWMVRISEGIWPEEVTEAKYFTSRGEYKVDKDASETMKNSLMYKLSYYRCAPFPPSSPFPAGSDSLSIQLRGALRRWTRSRPCSQSANSADADPARHSRFVFPLFLPLVCLPLMLPSSMLAEEAFTSENWIVRLPFLSPFLRPFR